MELVYKIKNVFGIDFILNKIRDVKEQTRQSIISSKKAEISGMFKIDVIDENMYIVCGSLAVKKIDPRLTCEDIITMLDEMKDSAIQYESYNFP